MTIVSSSLAMGAILSSGGTPGTILVDNGVSNPSFSVSSCTVDAVVVSGIDANSLQQGHILTYIGNMGHYDESICSNCSPLFRKVVESISNEDNTYTLMTAMASFAEVFPDDVYDASLADSYIEPYFNCDHSHHEGKHRLLEDNEDFCDSVDIVSIVFGVLALCFVCFAPCYTIIVAILQLIAVFECDRLMGEVTEAERGLRASPSKTTSPFPTSCKDWMDRDTNGNCLYVDGAAHGCFGCDNDTSSASSCRDNLDNSMLDVSDEKFHANFDFNEAQCNQGYCYSSKFSKEKCDNNFYKAMEVTCRSSESPAILPSAFPLNTSVLSHHCQMVSVLFYLGMKIFGKSSYENSQLKQLEYHDISAAHADIQM